MNKQVEAILAEIERQKEYSHKMSDKANSNRMKYYFDGADEVCNQILSYIDSLPEEKPSKDLETEIATWIPAHINGNADKDTTDAIKLWGENVARHFYELGCHRTAEMYDDIEYNRQMAEEKQPASEKLEEEARKYLTDNFTPPGEEPLNTEDAAYTLWFDDVCHIARHFAEWGAEHGKSNFVIELGERI